MNVGRDVRLNSCLETNAAQTRSAFARTVIELAEHHERIRANVADVSGRGDEADDAAQTAQYMFARYCACEELRSIDAVLQRNDHRILADHRPDQFGSGGNLVRLDRD